MTYKVCLEEFPEFTVNADSEEDAVNLVIDSFAFFQDEPSPPFPAISITPVPQD